MRGLRLRVPGLRVPGLRHAAPTIRHRAGPGALGDAVLYLDWHEDGHGYRGYDYTGSPSV